MRSEAATLLPDLNVLQSITFLIWFFMFLKSIWEREGVGAYSF